MYLAAPLSSQSVDDDNDDDNDDGDSCRRLRIEVGFILAVTEVGNAFRSVSMDDKDLVWSGRVSRKRCDGPDDDEEVGAVQSVLLLVLVLPMLPRRNDRSRPRSEAQSDDDDENNRDGNMGGVPRLIIP